MIKLGGIVDLKAINEAEVFTATSKETGTTSVFKSKASRDAAIKAGTHQMKKDDKAGAVKDPTKKDTPKTNIFNKDKEQPKQDEPTKDSTGDRAGNLEVNKVVRAKAKKLGITPQKLGKEEYQKKMAQAAVAALTDANFHSEARQLVADLEGKPEMAEKPDYPKMDDPKFKEKMDVIRTKYDSVYSEPDDDSEDLGISAAQEASWDGRDAIDSIAFDLKMNGFKDLAKKIQSVIKENKSTRLAKLINK